MTTTLPNRPAAVQNDSFPSRLARDYRPDRVLGYGSLGPVIVARGVLSGRPVEVKILAGPLAGSERIAARFLWAAERAARLSHPNVVRVLGAGIDEGPFVVMEHIEGETLAENVARDGRLAGRETLTLATHLAAGLAHAHSCGVVHGGLDAHSIVLGADGVARLTDFEFARVLADAPCATAGDIYAFGTVLRQVAGEDLPPALAAIVDGTLVTDPAARPSAVDLHHQLLTLSGPPDVWLPPAEASIWRPAVEVDGGTRPAVAAVG